MLRHDREVDDEGGETYAGVDEYLKRHPERAGEVFAAHRAALQDTVRAHRNAEAAHLPAAKPDFQISHDDAVSLAAVLLTVLRQDVPDPSADRANRVRARKLLDRGVLTADALMEACDVWDSEHPRSR